jgi:hypothetical protein
LSAKTSDFGAISTLNCTISTELALSSGISPFCSNIPDENEQRNKQVFFYTRKNDRLQDWYTAYQIVEIDHLQKRVEGGSNASHCATIPADGY